MGIDGPSLSISDVTVKEGDIVGGGKTGAGTIARGPLSTSGNQIIDSSGAPVEVRAVNWFGGETAVSAPHGLSKGNYQEMLDQIVNIGFNAIHLPFSSDMVLKNPIPLGINLAKNPDVGGLKSLEVFDKIIAYADEIGLRVLLDHHRSTAGDGANGNGLWYGEGGYTEADWMGLSQT